MQMHMIGSLLSLLVIQANTTSEAYVARPQNLTSLIQPAFPHALSGGLLRAKSVFLLATRRTDLATTARVNAFVPVLPHKIPAVFVAQPDSTVNGATTQLKRASSQYNSFASVRARMRRVKLTSTD